MAKSSTKRNSEKSRSLDATTWREMPTLALKGFCMGSADVVPGVSGGTMALILGIYERLLEAVKSFNRQTVQAALARQWRELIQLLHWRFLAALLTGIMAAVIFFTRIVRLPELMNTHPEPIYGLFFGLILGSIWFVTRDSGLNKYRQLLWLLLGTLAGLRVVTLVPTNTPETALFAFFSGGIAVIALILPGISGSFILLILRQYEHIFGQFSDIGLDMALNLQALMILLPFFIGMVCGIVLFARMLSWLLRHWHRQTYLILAGFMLGSLWVIWPWQDRIYELVRGKQRLVSSTPRLPEPGTPEFFWGLTMIVVGGVAVLFLEVISRKKNHSPPPSRSSGGNCGMLLLCLGLATAAGSTASGQPPPPSSPPLVQTASSYLYGDTEALRDYQGSLTVEFTESCEHRLVIAYGRRYRKDRHPRAESTEEQRHRYKPVLAAMTENGRKAIFKHLPPDFYDLIIINPKRETIHEGLQLLQPLNRQEIETFSQDSRDELFKTATSALAPEPEAAGGWEAFFDHRNFLRFETDGARGAMLMHQKRLGRAVEHSARPLQGHVHSLDIVWLDHAEKIQSWQVRERQQLYRRKLTSDEFFSHRFMQELHNIRIGFRANHIGPLELPR